MLIGLLVEGGVHQFFLVTTKTTPKRISVAPTAKSGAGISWKRLMPRRVAPTGSRSAIVAVSKDFRFESDEK